MVKNSKKKMPAAKATCKAASKAASKKKVVPKHIVEKGTMDLFSDVEKADLAYIMRGLESSPQLVPWLASLMRDGVLEKTLKVKLQGSQPAQLGKKLGDKLKRFRNLPPRFWNLLWLNTWVKAPDFEEKGNKLQLEQHQAIAEWSLRIEIDGWLPSSHKGAGYEGPLLAVLKARHDQHGALLQSLDIPKVRAGDFGYFTIASPFDGNVGVRGTTIQLEVVNSERVAEASDWTLEENTNRDAALVSETLGFQQNIFVLMKRHLPKKDFEQHFPEHQETFELPNAADRFPDPKVYDDAIVAQAPASSDAASSAAPSSSSSSSSGGVVVGGVVVTPLKQRRSLSTEQISNP